MKSDLIIINANLFYLKDKNVQYYTIVFNILFNAHPSKLKKQLNNKITIF